jgi:hypothetical protein
MMKDIYSGCSVVYIWLGAPEDPASITQDHFAFIHHFGDGKHYKGLPCYYEDESGKLCFDESNADINVLWENFLRIARSPWWTHSWTVQEAILPERSIVLYWYYKSSMAAMNNARMNRNKHYYFDVHCCRDGKNIFPAAKGRIFGSFLGEIEWL